MKNDPLLAASSRETPQSRRADARQRRNAAGGYAFTLDDLARLRRFLVLGVDGGTYYATARDLALANAAVVTRLAESNHRALVDEVVAISEAGRAPRQQPALFALAVAASRGDAEERRYALDRLARVARTGTHLAIFLNYVQQHRGWGRQLRRAVAEWYLRAPTGAVAYQAVKYRQREGWTHRDVLRKSHPATTEAERRALFEWITHPDGSPTESRDAASFELVAAFEEAQRATDARTWTRLAAETQLPWEAFPDAALGERRVWETLLTRPGGVPLNALLRQLPRLTRLGVLPDNAEVTRVVCDRLRDVEALRRARVHPLSVLVAQRTYASGASARGSSTWQPARAVVDALDDAFYASFGAIQPAGRRVVLALDVSASMTWDTVAGSPLTPREASAALALVTAATESDYHIVAFTWGAARSIRDPLGVEPLTISPRQRLDDVLRRVESLHAGGTDCALPMLYALERGLEADAFVVYTDNETWAGSIHPHQALRRYRERTGIDARLVVVGMTATEFTIADPADLGMLDVVGFDAATPTLVADFARGDVG